MKFGLKFLALVTLAVVIVSLTFIWWQRLPRNWSFIYDDMTVYGFSRGPEVLCTKATLKFRHGRAKGGEIILYINEVPTPLELITETGLLETVPGLEVKHNPVGVRYVSGYVRGGLLTFYYSEPDDYYILSLTETSSPSSQHPNLPFVSFTYDSQNRVQLPVSKAKLYKLAGNPREVMSVMAFQ